MHELTEISSDWHNTKSKHTFGVATYCAGITCTNTRA